jgi:hypothetical protein
MTTRLLYNVSAFMRTNQPVSATYRPGPDRAWPIHVQLGPGGEDTIDIYADVKEATRLRDKLTTAIAQHAQTEAAAAHPCSITCSDPAAHAEGGHDL